jgi:hypothetical protein
MRPYEKFGTIPDDFGVGPVQPLIDRWRRIENQLNRRKYQTILEKSQTWWFPNPWHVRTWEKVWDQYGTEMHMNYKILGT